MRINVHIHIYIYSLEIETMVDTFEAMIFILFVSLIVNKSDA